MLLILQKMVQQLDIVLMGNMGYLHLIFNNGKKFDEKM